MIDNNYHGRMEEGKKGEKWEKEDGDGVDGVNGDGGGHFLHDGIET